MPAVRSEATTPNRAAAFALSLDRPEALNQNRGVVISNGFGVGLGPPAALRLLQSPGLAEEEEEGEEGGVQAAAAACVGGMAFASPPVVEVVDAGGNRLVTDYDSAVEVSFAAHPSEGRLEPSEYTLLRCVAGLARFSQLRIDRAGQRYRLKFTYLAFNTTPL